MKRVFIKTETNEQHILDHVKAAKVGDMIQIGDPTRTLEQNALMWPYLDCLHRQLPWPVLVNGKWDRQNLSNWDWKHLLTGSFEGDAARMAQGTDGTGLVMLGQSTSGFGKKKFSEFITFVQAFGAKQNVKFMDQP